MTPPPTGPELKMHWYQAQERAMAPGIAGEWPKVIPHPSSPHGRLVRRDGDPEQEIATLRAQLEEAQHRITAAEALAEAHRQDSEDVDRYIERLEAAEQQIAALRKVLQDVEWGAEAGACPCCSGKPHMEFCDLAKLLTGGEVK